MTTPNPTDDFAETAQQAREANAAGEARINETIADFAEVVERTRKAHAAADDRVAEIQAAQYALRSAAPHTDDIVAVFRRGLATSIDGFERKFATELKGRFAAQDGTAGPAAGKNSALNILRFGGTTANVQLDLSVWALCYFLRDRIDAELPELIARLCPEAATGIKQADRDQAAANLQSELEETLRQREALANDLGAARRAVVRS